MPIAVSIETIKPLILDYMAAVLFWQLLEDVKISRR